MLTLTLTLALTLTLPLALTLTLPLALTLTLPLALPPALPLPLPLPLIRPRRCVRSLACTVGWRGASLTVASADCLWYPSPL